MLVLQVKSHRTYHASLTYFCDVLLSLDNTQVFSHINVLCCLKPLSSWVFVFFFISDRIVLQLVNWFRIVYARSVYHVRAS